MCKKVATAPVPFIRTSYILTGRRAALYTNKRKTVRTDGFLSVFFTFPLSAPPSLPEYHRKVLTDMKRELSRMTRLIDDLLVLARNDSGQLEIMRQPFDLKMTVESTVMAFSLLSDKREISLVWDVQLTDGDPSFRGDEERLNQLLYILLDNALKYNKPEGEIRLEVRKTPQELQIGVTDTGIGIPSEDLPHIFDRFYRVHKGRSRSSGGVGLGLAIAAWIVKAHGGRIRAESRVGEGTAVKVTLPRQ
ncbi:HAMP domain-containing sensor histidine kinase [Paenibacillus filicis]|uniref:histidine kinase n=1 Tax=Paenibacillus gyeongsangnamensis TaxID=3388067 RepID=A0ABT4QFS7_9BACL|nr:HAMP domain-containing sensor histidine kinase [Paenibacillus filicis]MCZ8515714.1 HAMP domain-containing sensor histidine kinase [Paenibacillus filicis]